MYKSVISVLPVLTLKPVFSQEDHFRVVHFIKEANIDIAVFNPAMGYLANSTTYAENGGDLDDILLSARTQYICGNIDQEEFQKQLELWLSRGGQAVIDEVNEQYQADK